MYRLLVVLLPKILHHHFFDLKMVRFTNKKKINHYLILLSNEIIYSKRKNLAPG